MFQTWQQPEDGKMTERQSLSDTGGKDMWHQPSFLFE